MTIRREAVKITGVMCDWKESFDAKRLNHAKKVVGGEGLFYDVDTGTDDNALLVSSHRLSKKDLEAISDVGNLYAVLRAWSGKDVKEIVSKIKKEFGKEIAENVE